MENNIIDNYAKSLLFELTKPECKYYKGKEIYGGLSYDINGKKVLIKWFNRYDDTVNTNNRITIDDLRQANIFKWDVDYRLFEKEKQGHNFVIEIEELRHLKVPKLTRKEEAEIFDNIETLVNWHELTTLKKLSDILEFNNNSF